MIYLDFVVKQITTIDLIIIYQRNPTKKQIGLPYYTVKLMSKLDVC